MHPGLFIWTYLGTNSKKKKNYFTKKQIQIDKSEEKNLTTFLTKYSKNFFFKFQQKLEKKAIFLVAIKSHVYFIVG